MAGGAVFVTWAGGDVEHGVDVRQTSDVIESELGDNLVVLVVDDERVSMGTTENL